MRPTTFRTSRALVLAVAAVAGLAACGGSSSGSSTGGGGGGGVAHATPPSVPMLQSVGAG